MSGVGRGVPGVRTYNQPSGGLPAVQGQASKAPLLHRVAMHLSPTSHTFDVFILRITNIEDAA